ncbi:hypothetical protein EPN96_09380 [bacterium]|nr:MAG: hypothetical protein EPN96_09380 [bacterium]
MKLTGVGSRLLAGFALLFLAFFLALSECRAADKVEPAKSGGPESVKLGDAGDKIEINDNFYFTWEFDKTPAMGPLVLKIKLYGADKERTTALVIKGSSDMPSMRGAHYTGDHPFKISKKGDYLLPVDVVMPGDWEIQIMFLSGETVIFRGHIDFDV